MPDHEYVVIPAPARGEKARGARTATDRFATALTAVLNGMAAQGWDYVRAETLPSEERSGLTSRTTVWHNLLVFRRAVGPRAGAAAAAAAPAVGRLAEADGALVAEALVEAPAETPADSPVAPPPGPAPGGPAFQPMRPGPREAGEG